ncbi:MULTISPECIES: winged helix-turn-helix transcriptional regulator [Methylosinus]|uniref:Transcriptional regulator n=1 Tax=Methylosinus sporium TaxID=428 RepID=A0A2U1SNV8_METSR|nr:MULTISPECIES: helix-turn-helix domain-containing protein [Methylosinus]MBU3889731.1 helix-turn-helix transcriptional regulator [Methylosinus sp. KRF6]PWB93290.1 transcriptional regulator [Methylosinus sporium]TRL23909.1 helix-turn-helix transcriptional regulator [Methylosinus sporium]
MERGHIHVPAQCGRIAAILSRIGDKWTVLVVESLGNGPLRFNELRRRIGGISQRMLTLTLRAAERDGFVTRTVFPTIPPRVDYELTPLGRSLREPLHRLGDWALENVETIEESRRRFDGEAEKQAAAPRPQRAVGA